jgi:hypothetical protein
VALDLDDFPQELVLAAHTPFDFGHQVFGVTQVIEGLLEGISGVLCLAAITCEAFLRCAASPLTGFRVVLGVSYAWRHGVILHCVEVCGGGSLSKRT